MIQNFRLPRWLLLLFILIVTAMTYWQILSAPYLHWDDDKNIWNNLVLTRGDLSSVWHQAIYGLYVPITSTIWSCLFRWGDGQALPFRILSLSLHLLNIGLLYRILTNRKQGSIAVALATFFFALHPVQVGAVAWISGSRDLLATAAALLAVLSLQKRRPYAGFIFYAIGLLCKPSIVALPVFLVAFLEHSSWQKRARSYLPWLAVAMIVSWVTYQAQTYALPPETPLWFRPVVALDSFGFYWNQLAWPFSLATDYGRTPTFLLGHPEALWASLPATVIVIIAFAKFLPKNLAFIALSWFVLMAPTSGLVPFGFQVISTVADHYQYLSMIIVAFLVGELLTHFPAKSLRMISLGVLIGYAVYDFQRVEVWTDEKTFFTDMEQKNPRSYSAAIGVGNWNHSVGNYQEAVTWYQRAIEIRPPQDPVATANLAASEFQLGRWSDIWQLGGLLESPIFRERLNSDRDSASSFYSSLGSAAWILEKPRQGWLLNCLAAQIEPDSPLYQHNLKYMADHAPSQEIKGPCPSLDQSGVQNLVVPR